MAQRAACRICLALLAAWSFLAAPVQPARADDTEQRDFTILVDGKAAGASRMTIIQKDDGITYMKASAEVKLQGIFAYSFRVEAEEWWKDGKLIGLKAQSQENKKHAQVVVGSDGKVLTLSVDGKKRGLGPEVWTTSYWKLADARFHNKEIPVLETDTGNTFMGRLQFVRGEEKITIAGKLENCYHFCVHGPTGPCDLWFDRFHRLVRQEFTESGHRTIVQLDSIRR
jgi:hypothetical protein